MIKPSERLHALLAGKVLGCVFLLLGSAAVLRADQPYAPSKDYDLQHSKIALRFDVSQKMVVGDVTHTVTPLREGVKQIAFDSVGLQIHSVKVDRSDAKFTTTAEKLIVDLPKTGKIGEKYEIEIKYDGKPSKGLYFILPDKVYPDRPAQVWTQGESEDTRYYLPTYDYPNDRLTTEMIVTVPSNWVTVSNGKLISTTDAGGGLKTWTWRESLPSSTYLISLVAGEFSEAKDKWRNIPVDYFAPKGREDRLMPNYNRTPKMIELFSKTLGVDYPWEKYDQSMVDDFVAGGMENSSATTNTSSSLRDPKLVSEYPTDEDDLISHELGHQWFGDLVTTKDWANIWLNEGFATYMESVWAEGYYGKDEADYLRWEAGRRWFHQPQLYERPIVRHDFSDSGEFDENVYTKGGWVLYMLRHQIGDAAFYAGLKHYLEVNRGKNVVTADLIKAIEEATHIDVDQFFDQWVYKAGAPRFEVSYTFDPAKKAVDLTVKQTQKVQDLVGLFRVPIDVEITTASGAKLSTIVVSKAEETFTLPSDSAPLMVLFDKGGQALKSMEFKKGKPELLYQIKNASELADRADAAAALGKLKEDADVAAALGHALRNDKARGVREVAAGALGNLNTPEAAKELLTALDTAKEPPVRAAIVEALGSFKANPDITAKLESVASQDSSYRARGAALQSIGEIKTPKALEILTVAVKGESPDGFLRNAALRGFGPLGDDRAVPLLREWAAPGKEVSSRQAAIMSLARLDKGDKQVTKQLIGYLDDSEFLVRMSAVFALGARGDATAIPAMEALLKSDNLSIEMAPMIKMQIHRLQNPGKGGSAGPMGMDGGEETPETEAAVSKPNEDQRLSRLEHLVEEMNERLKVIEARLTPTPKAAAANP